MGIPDITNLANCTQDARSALLDSDSGPENVTDFNELLQRLSPCRKKLPSLYRNSVYDPFVQTLTGLGENEFNQLMTFPNAALVANDISQAILQKGEGYQGKATDAFQEVVSDLYDGFLSAEDRASVNPPDQGVIAPLVKWGRPDFGPYTLPINATKNFGLKAGIVSLPPSNGRKGILAWSALGHETAGHDILHADTGLQTQLTQAVFDSLSNNGLGNLAVYWAKRMDETASDVMGILNMGPAAGIGLVGYFRGFNDLGKLRNSGNPTDEHPLDILRGYLAAEVVKLLSFSNATAWAQIIEKETDKDFTGVVINGNNISQVDAKKSAALIAKAICDTKVSSLENHSLRQIQDWTDEDEAVVDKLESIIKLNNLLSLELAVVTGAFAAHAVAAGVMAALRAHSNIPLIFSRMVSILKLMHNKNASWGPLFIAHPGDLAIRRAYIE